MIDVSSNLLTAIPASYTAASRLPTAVSKLKPPENLSGSLSLKTVSEKLQPETSLSDFGPPARGEEGFASLGPVLSSLRIAPDQLSAKSQTDEKAVWEQLYEEQMRIAEAREQAAERYEKILQARDDWQEKQQEQAENDNTPLESTAIDNQTETEDRQTPQFNRVASSESQTPFRAKSPNETLSENAIQQDQQRIQKLFSSATSSKPAGSTVDAFV